MAKQVMLAFVEWLKDPHITIYVEDSKRVAELEKSNTDLAVALKTLKEQNTQAVNRYVEYVTENMRLIDLCRAHGIKWRR